MNQFQKQAFLNGLDAELATLRGDIKCEGVDMLKMFDSSSQVPTPHHVAASSSIRMKPIKDLNATSRVRYN